MTIIAHGRYFGQVAWASRPTNPQNGDMLTLAGDADVYGNASLVYASGTLLVYSKAGNAWYPSTVRQTASLKQTVTAASTDLQPLAGEQFADSTARAVNIYLPQRGVAANTPPVIIKAIKLVYPITVYPSRYDAASDKYIDGSASVSFATEGDSMTFTQKPSGGWAII